MDNQHTKLFDMIRDCRNHPEDSDKYQKLNDTMRLHFNEEQAKFNLIQNNGDYAVDHISKHDAFLALMDQNKVPLTCEFTDYMGYW